jgi:hypothetical protein
VRLSRRLKKWPPQKISTSEHLELLYVTFNQKKVKEGLHDTIKLRNLRWGDLSWIPFEGCMLSHVPIRDRRSLTHMEKNVI